MHEREGGVWGWGGRERGHLGLGGGSAVAIAGRRDGEAFEHIFYSKKIVIIWRDTHS